MKRFLYALLIIVISSSAVSAQSLRLVGGIGGNYSIGSYKGLNFVIDRYNATRQGQTGAATVTRPMSNINSLVGVSWQIGFTLENASGLTLYTGINRVGRSATSYAEATDINNNTGRRDVRFTSNSLNFELGLGKHMGFGYILAGGSLDMFSAKAYTRINSNDYDEVMDDFNLGMSLFLDISVFVTSRFAIGIKPYLQTGLLKTDFTDLNRAINSATSTRDSFEDQQSSPLNVGTQVFLRIFTLNE
jgi:hypothetical protein